MGLYTYRVSPKYFPVIIEMELVHKLPLYVYNLKQHKNIYRAILHFRYENIEGIEVTH